jgi:hypothetical protein
MLQESAICVHWPRLCLRLGDADGLRASQLQHSVQGCESNVHLGLATLVDMPEADRPLPRHKAGLTCGASLNKPAVFTECVISARSCIIFRASRVGESPGHPREALDGYLTSQGEWMDSCLTLYLEVASPSDATRHARRVQFSSGRVSSEQKPRRVNRRRSNSASSISGGTD